MKNQNQFKSVLFVIAFTLIGCGSFPESANEAISVKTKVIPAKELSDSEQRDIAKVTSHMLMHVNKARAALEKKQYERAKSNIVKAKKLKEVVQNAIPEVSVSSVIKSGKLVFKDKDSFKPVVVQLYDELDKIELMKPLVSTNKKDIDGIMIDGIEYDHSAAFLDLGQVDHVLSLALKDINNKKYNLAKVDLDEVFRSIIFENDVIDAPLQTIATNLSIANDYISNDKYQNAKGILSKTSKMLEKISKGSFINKERKSEFQKLSGELNDLQSDVKASNKASLTSKIKRYWHKVKIWMS